MAPIRTLPLLAVVAALLVPASAPAKIQIGISFYAYNWPNNGGSGVAQTWAQVQEIIEEYQPRIDLTEGYGNQPVQESHFNYAGRTVWFSNYRSLTAKMEMVREMDLAGIAIWRLGNEDPKNWDYIHESLQRDPVIIQRTINSYIPGH